MDWACFPVSQSRVSFMASPSSRTCYNSVASKGLRPTFLANSTTYFTASSTNAVRLSRYPLNSAQVLDGLDTPCATSRRCLTALKEICGARRVPLAMSCVLSPHRLNVRPDPSATGGCCNGHRGTLRGRSVRVKRVRVPQQKHLSAAQKARVGTKPPS